MAQTAKSIILSKFEAGDRPTDQDFLNLFDSVLFINNVGQHANGLSTSDTSIEGNFKIEGDLEIGGTSVLELGNSLGIGNTTENVTSTLHVYSDHASNPVVFISGSNTNIMFNGVSGDATSSIQLTDPTNFAEFGTHTGKAFISVAGSEYFNITGSNLGPHSFFSGSVGIGSVANTNATERLRIFDANKNVSAHLQTSKVGGTSTIGFENDAQSYTFGVRSNDNLTIVNATGTPFKVKSTATTDNLVLDGGRVGIGVSSPTYPLHIEAYNDSAAFFKSTDDGPTYIRIDTSTADADTHSAVLYMENGAPMGASGYNAETNTIALTYATGINSTSGININQNGSIGIGTKSPGYKLDVVDTINDVSLRLQTDKTDGAAAIRFKNDAREYTTGITTNDLFAVYDATAATVPFRIEPGTPDGTLTVDSNGRVGIGTTAPANTLDVRGDVVLSNGTDNAITLYNNDDASAGPDIQFHINGLIAAENALHLNINSNSGTDDFSIRTGGDTSAAAEIFKITAAGQVSASGGFVGDGSQLTGITGGQLTGFVTTPGDNRLITSNAAGDAVIGEANLIFDGTNLGIGTTPGVLLDLQGNANTAKLRITSIDTSQPAKTAHIELIGYEGRAKGILFNDSTLPDDHWFVGTPYVDTDGESFIIGYDGANAEPEYVANAKLYVSSSGNVGIGTDTPDVKLEVVGNTAIRNTGDTANVMLFQNDNIANTKADILFNASGLITAEDSLFMAINSTGGTGTFDIRTGDPQNGGEGNTNTSLIASFGTGSVGSVLSMHGGLQDNKPAQIQFNLGAGGLNNSGSDDGARIKYSTVNSQGGFYDANNLDFLVFEKLDANNTNSPDGGILFTNSALGSGGDTTENVSMAIRGSGRVGIGTISPDCQLSVSAGSDDLFSRFFSTTHEDKVKGIRLSAEDAGGTATYFDIVVDPLGNKIGLGLGAGSATLPIGDANLDNAELVIDSDGKVGIGTSSPGVKLEVVSPSATNETLRLRSLGASTDPYLSFYNENTHRTRRAYIQAVSNAGTGTGNELRLVSDTGGITFYTSPVDGTYSTPVENFRVEAGGDVKMRHDKKIQLGGTLGGANDYGFIKFNYTSDSDSSLELGTYDNSNEPIIFTQTGNERARIDTLGIQVQERITSPDTQHTLITNSGGGYIEAKSNNSTYGLIVRDYNSSNYMNIDANSGYGTIGYNTSDGPLFLSDDDRVGINYSTPAYKLHVVEDSQDTIAKFTSTFDNGYVRIRQSVDTTGAAGILTENSAGIKGFVGYYDTKMRLVAGTGPGTDAGILIDSSGNVDLAGTLEIGGTGHSIYMADYDDGTINTRLICRDNALEVFEGGFIVGNYNNDVFSGDSAITEKVMHTGQIRIGTPADDNYRRIFMSSDRMFFQQMSGTSWDSTAPYIENGDAEGNIQTFTGQHRNKPSSNISNYVDKTGYIVVSSGVYSNIPENRTKEEIEINNTEVLTTPQIDEALPIVELSTTANDKKVFGVIGGFDDPDSTDRDVVVQGGFNLQIVNRVDNRLVINSLGEGAIMVSNINGNLENGDYITTSAIEGLGMKQDDDLLHNYTVAKITQDCDFSSNTTDVTHDGQTYKMKLVGCTYHCG